MALLRLPWWLSGKESVNVGDSGSILGSRRSPGEGMAWKVPRTKEPGGLQSVGPQRVGQDWVTKQQLNTNHGAASLCWILPSERAEAILRPVTARLFIWSWQITLTCVKAHSPNFYQQKRFPWQFHITNRLFGQTKACTNRTPQGWGKQEGALGRSLHSFTVKKSFCPTELHSSAQLDTYK